MSPRALSVEPDGTLILEPQQIADAVAVEAALSAFADRTSPQRYRLSAPSIWRARRAGLALSDILQTLETYSRGDLPANLRSDLVRWSQQIERLTLEVSQGRLVLRSANPLVITAVLQHRTLGDVVIRQRDATTAELRAEAYPVLLATFDACHYPVMDRVPAGWQPGEVVPLPATRPQPHPVPQPSQRLAQAHRRRAARASRLQWLSHPCQATTRAGRPCKNRAQPGARFCHVHTPWFPSEASVDRYLAATPLLHQRVTSLLEHGLVTLPQVVVARMVMLMGLGLLTWLLALLLLWCGVGGSVLPLPRWAVIGVSLVSTCGLVGRLVGGVGLVASLAQVGLMLLAILLDCLHKEGLILNLCFVGIPVLLPAWVLAQYGVALGWVFMCVPVGLVVGQCVYSFLDAMSA